MIKNYKTFVNEKVYVDEFLRLYNLAPENLKKEINDTKKAEQSIEWHPEGNTYIHIRLVTNRLANCYKDINLTLSGLFHDLGKTETTKFDDEKQSWTAYGHEEISVRILNNYKDWIEEMGGDLNIIEYIVANHMRYKYIDEMRMQEQILFMEHPYFEYIEKFGSADYGGTDLICKEIPNYKDIKNKINEFNKKNEENKIISSKFNGRLVMDKYPKLKGVELGNVLNNFKNSFEDFREFVLKNSSEEIMKKFDEFMESINEGLRDKMKPKSEEEITDIKKEIEDIFINQQKCKYLILKYLETIDFNFDYNIERIKKDNYKSGFGDNIGNILITDFIKEHKKIIPNFNNLSYNEQDSAWDDSIKIITKNIKKILDNFDFKLKSLSYGQGDLLIKFSIPNEHKYIYSKNLPKIVIDNI